MWYLVKHRDMTGFVKTRAGVAQPYSD